MNKPEGTVKTDEGFVCKGAEKITRREVEEVVEKSELIESKFKSFRALGKYFEGARLMLALIRDYWRGDYRETPWFTIAAIVFMLLYVLNPFDLVPDMIPFIGLVDDVFAFSIAFKIAEKDLQRYKKWKLARESG